MKYIIFGLYNHTKEELDEADTQKEALRLVQEYRLAFGSEWKIWCQAVKR